MRIFLCCLQILFFSYSVYADADTCNPVLNNIKSDIKISTKSSVGVKVIFTIVDGVEIIQEGTGFILNKDGYILTALHVLKLKNSLPSLNFKNISYEITFSNYKKHKAIFFWGGEKVGFPLDVAILKINDSPSQLVPARIDYVNKLKYGDKVFAIGSPSSIDKIASGNVLKTNITTEGWGVIRLIYATTPIKRGNSGGMLVNNRGHVVGMTVGCKGVDAGGVGFVCVKDGYFLPINLIMKWVNFLKLPHR